MSLIESGPLVSRVADMERAVGQDEWSAAAGFFTESVRYSVAGRGSFEGVAGIRDYMQWQRSWVEWTGHSPEMMIERDDIVVIEVVSHFRRLRDGDALAIPCTDIYRFDGRRICDWRVYADTAVFHGEVSRPGPGGLAGATGD